MSVASGEYIVTIDDDLEYLPEDIITLYDYIKANNFHVVFGIAEEKYRLQGKNTRLAKGRTRLLNALWGKGVTDSFKIFKKELVFDADSFIVEEHFEAFIKHRLAQSFWGYTAVGYEARMAGSSNHTFLKKLKLFFLFTAQYFSKKKTKPLWLISERAYSQGIIS
jgi:glycosyltransferase involved in cell wall biosynthesis